MSIQRTINFNQRIKPKGIPSATVLQSSPSRSTRSHASKPPPIEWNQLPIFQPSTNAPYDSTSTASVNNTDESAKSYINLNAQGRLNLNESRNLNVSPNLNLKGRITSPMPASQSSSSSSSRVKSNSSGKNVDKSILDWCKSNVHYSVRPDLNSKIKLYQGDITRLAVDAIVNAANNGLWSGGGICGAIFDAAGEWQLERECQSIISASGRVPTGQSRLTHGYQLPAKYIIHTVGPKDGSRRDLKQAYLSTYDLAVNPVLFKTKPSDENMSIRTIGLCCISTGIYGFPNGEAALIALQTTRDWLEADPDHARQLDGIVFCTFLDKDQQLYEKLIPFFFPTQANDDTDNNEENINSSHGADKVNEPKEPSASKAVASSSAQSTSSDHSDNLNDNNASALPTPLTLKKRKSEDSDESTLKESTRTDGVYEGSTAIKANASTSDQSILSTDFHLQKRPKVDADQENP